MDARPRRLAGSISGGELGQAKGNHPKASCVDEKARRAQQTEGCSGCPVSVTELVKEHERLCNEERPSHEPGARPLLTGTP